MRADRPEVAHFARFSGIGVDRVGPGQSDPTCEAPKYLGLCSVPIVPDWLLLWGGGSVPVTKALDVFLLVELPSHRWECHVGGA